jgi:hypothetical protein
VAIRRALKIVANYDLDVRLVSYGKPTTTMLRIVEDFQ